MDCHKQYFAGEDYLLMEGIPDPGMIERSIDFIWQTLSLHPGSRVLDAGCGGGQIAVSLAQRGCIVTAIDSSEFMLDWCRRTAAGTSGITILKQDYLSMSYHAEFDAVISWNHSIGYGSREEDKDTIGSMARALVPGGKILLDLHNLSAYLKYFVTRHWEERDSAFVLMEAEFDHAESRFLCRNIIVPKDGKPSREYNTAMLEYEPEAIAAVLESAGIEEISFFGDSCAAEGGPLFCSEGYNNESAVMIVTGVKSIPKT